LEEKEHVQRCRSVRRKLELVGSRSAAKIIVRSYFREIWNLDLPPDAVRVGKRPSGVPVVVASMPDPAVPRPPRLSLTHNRSYCWAALARDRFRVGVDIQEIESRIQSLTSFFLDKSEMDIVRSTAGPVSEAQEAAYTAAWSAKEAAFKCIGRKVSFRKFCLQARILRMKEDGALLTWGDSTYFVRQICTSGTVFSVLNIPEV